MKIKTSELEGAALDWSVATALGWSEDEESWVTGDKVVPRVWDFRPSTDWSQGGPLIEKYCIELHTNIGEHHGEHERWYAVAPISASSSRGALGSAPLIAAMRAFVASELGDEVEIPEDLA